MLQRDTRRAVARLAASVLSVKPLVGGRGAPVRVVPVSRDAAVSRPDWSSGQWNALRGLLDRIAGNMAVAGLILSRNVVFDELQVFERAVSNRLGLVDWMNSTAVVPADLLGEVDQVVAETLAASFDAFCRKETVSSFDGVPLSTYAAGQAGDAVVLVPACGMPATLMESWVRFLARDHCVLTWESRGLFGEVDQQADYAVDTAAQAADLFAVMAHYGVPSAHVIGLCGGTVIALVAAAHQPGSISSLSLWHGAYEFADGCPKTRHQHSLVELMTMAARSRGASRAVHTAFCQTALTNVPADLAHLVLYPYASPELFYRYCRLNGEITSTDVGKYLARVKQPTLVVTSQDDEIAHPAGSKRVAAGLSNARLRVAAHGNHISLFNADDTTLQVAVDFIAQCRTTCGRNE